MNVARNVQALSSRTMTNPRGRVTQAHIGIVSGRVLSPRPVWFRRPVVVVQGDAFNRSSLETVVCVALTSS